MDIREARKPAGVPPGTQPPRTVAEAPAQAAMEPEERPEAPEARADGDLRSEFLIRQYLDYLERHDVSREDILALLDSIIAGKSVVWEFALFGKIPVRFRLRLAWMDDAILRHLDRQSKDADMSVARYNGLIGSCNLAASLSLYGERAFALENEKDFAASLAFVDTLPAAVRNALVSHLAIFDRAVACATSEWAVENFTEPRRDG